MWQDTLTGIQKDLNQYRARHPGLPKTVGHRPESITLSPDDWRGMVEALTRDRYAWRTEQATIPTLWGMRVIEDRTLAPGTWRLEHG